MLARQWARTMRGLLAVAAATGAVAAVGGFVLAYKLDWPVGPTDLALQGGLLAASWGGKACFRRRSASRV
jgi:ABC-type Mn2+/Zn2+ transport system permease subunit